MTAGLTQEFKASEDRGIGNESMLMFVTARALLLAASRGRLNGSNLERMPVEGDGRQSGPPGNIFSPPPLPSALGFPPGAASYGQAVITINAR
jgi:hypothetical protein